MVFWWATKKGRAQRRHDKIIYGYREFATNVGGCLADIHLGDATFRMGLKSFGVRDSITFEMLDFFEEEYASLGYRVVPIERWVDHGGWGVNLDDVWLVEREKDERPVYTKMKVSDIPKSSNFLAEVWHSGEPTEMTIDTDGNRHIRKINE